MGHACVMLIEEVMLEFGQLPLLGMCISKSILGGERVSNSVMFPENTVGKVM